MSEKCEKLSPTIPSLSLFVNFSFFKIFSAKVAVRCKLPVNRHPAERFFTAAASSDEGNSDDDHNARTVDGAALHSNNNTLQRQRVDLFVSLHYGTVEIVR